MGARTRPLMPNRHRSQELPATRDSSGRGEGAARSGVTARRGVDPANQVHTGVCGRGPVAWPKTSDMDDMRWTRGPRHRRSAEVAFRQAGMTSGVGGRSGVRRKFRGTRDSFQRRGTVLHELAANGFDSEPPYEGGAAGSPASDAPTHGDCEIVPRRSAESHPPPPGSSGGRALDPARKTRRA